MTFTLAGFILYLLIVLLVGFLTYNKNKNHADYFLAGRKLNPLVVAFSERASGESAWLLIGLPGVVLSFGLIEIWTAVGCVAGIIVSWFILAKDLRIETEKYQAITLPDFIAAKFEGRENLLRFISMLIIIFFFTFYLAAQFNAAGKVLFVTFGIKQIYGILTGTAVIIFYTMMGGFFAVVWTDLVQGLIMLGTLVILPVVGIYELSEQGISITDGFNIAGNSISSFTGGKAGWAAAAAVISGLSWGFGYLGQPHLLTRFMSIKDPEKIKTGRKIAITWAIPAFTGAVLIGLVGLSMYGSSHFSDPEFIMPELATTLLPEWLAGIFISGAIAAMMSTADSQLLVISSSVIEDFYHKTLGKELTESRMLFLSRIITLAVGIIGFLIAITSKELVFELVSYAWCGLGASFGPALLLLLKWKKTTWQGVLAGMITGSVTTVIWSNIAYLNDFINVRFTAFIFAFVFVVVFSLLTYKK